MVRLVFADDSELLIEDSCLDTAKVGDILHIQEGVAQATNVYTVQDMFFEVVGSKVIKVLFLR